MKLRHFYKIDQNKQPITGSNVKRKSSPGKQWKEILDVCCSPIDIDCTCGPRFFIQLDADNKPVPGTLIKRFSWPKMETGIRYYELNWKSICCTNITYSFSASNANAVFRILINGNEIVNINLDIITPLAEGVIKPNPGDSIEIIVSNDGDEEKSIVVTGGHTLSITDGIPSVSLSFVWNGKQSAIGAAIVGIA